MSRSAPDTIPAALLARAGEMPGRAAIRCAGETLTWCDLAARALEAAAKQDGGIAAIAARNDVETIVAIHGAMLAGAAAVPVDPATPAGTRYPPETATVIYTSGTTGRRRGAVLTHQNHMASATASAARLGTGPDDTWLLCLPLTHVAGLAILFRSVHDGSAVEVHPRFDAGAVASAITDGRVTCASFVARTLDLTLAALDDRHPRGLRAILVGGGPVPKPLMARARAAGLPVARTYGLTETASQVATQMPGDEDGTCGLPLPGIEVAIDGPPNSEGEILVRGPTVMHGYADGPPISGGWLRTGDWGRIDVAGRLTVLDRRDDLIITGGVNVYPAEVEAALCIHPAVEEACVVGIADSAWGQRVAAVVRLRAPVSDEDLDRHCRALLHPHQVPRVYVRTTAQIPRTATGKVRRTEVRAFGLAGP